MFQMHKAGCVHCSCPVHVQLLIDFILLFEVFVNDCSHYNEPCREKTCLWGFCPGPSETGLHSHRRWLEVSNFEFRK